MRRIFLFIGCSWRVVWCLLFTSPVWSQTDDLSVYWHISTTPDVDIFEDLSDISSELKIFQEGDTNSAEPSLLPTEEPLLLNLSSLTGNFTSDPLSLTPSEWSPEFLAHEVLIDEIFASDTASVREHIRLFSPTGYIWPLEVVGAAQGAGSKFFDVQMPPYSYIYISDDSNIFSTSWCEVILTSSLTLTDAGEFFQIKLFSWYLTDTVTTTSTLPWKTLLFTSSTSTGVRIFSSSGEPTLPYCFWFSPQNTWSWSQDPSVWSWQDIDSSWWTGIVFTSWDTVEVTTWDIVTGNTTTWTTLFWSCEVFPSTILITEIHPRVTSQFPEYLELFIDGYYSGQIDIIWAGQWSATKSFFLTWESGYLVITDSPNIFPEATKTIVITSLSLTDTGEEIQIIWHSWQVFDSGVYTIETQDKSLYFTSWTTPKILSTSDIPTPGFDVNQVNHLRFDKNFTPFYSCWIWLQTSKPLLFPNKINLIATLSGKDIQNSNSSYRCERILSWTDSVFDVCNPEFFSFTTGGVFPVTVKITDLGKGWVCQTTSWINYPLNPTEWKTCKQTYYQELYLKRKARFDHLKKWIGAYGLTANASGDVSQKTSSNKLLQTTTWALQIVSVLPNPAGKDDGQEVLRFRSVQSSPLYITKLYLSTGKSKKLLPFSGATVDPTTIITLTWTLGLTNKPTCITLQDTTQIYDSFCYPTAGDDQIFTESTDWLLSVHHQDPSLLGAITLTLEKTHACALFDKQEVICKLLRYSDDMVAELKKQAKTSSSLEKKLIKERERGDSFKQKYHDAVATRRKDTSLYKQKISLEKDRTRQARAQAHLHEEYAYILRNTFTSKRYSLYVSSSLPHLDDIKKYLDQALDENKSTLDRWWIILSSDQLETTQQLLVEGRLPLAEYNISLHLPSTLRITQQTIDDFLKNLTVSLETQPP